MKTKLLLFSALAFVILCFNGCTPDEVQTTQDQFKPLIIRATTSTPIHAPLNGGENFLNIGCQFGGQEINGNYPAQQGQNQIEIVTTSVANTPLNIHIQYYDAWPFDPDNSPVWNGDCSDIQLQVIYDNVIVFDQVRSLGGAQNVATTICGYGSFWQEIVTLP
jgi:hypothetical protein